MKDVEDCEVILKRVLNKLFPHIDVDSIIYNQKKGLSQEKYINIDTLTSYILSIQEQDELYFNYRKNMENLNISNLF